MIIFVRHGFLFSKLSIFSLFSLDPYSDYVEINISLTDFSSLSFLNVYTPPIRSSMDSTTDFFSPSILSSGNVFILGKFQLPSFPLRLKRYSDSRGEEEFDWVISSDLLSLNDPDVLNLRHRSSGSRSSPDIFFAPFSLVLTCSFDCHCLSAEEYSSLSLFSAAGLFIYLTLMRPNRPFFSAASNAILEPCSSLKWKMRLVKDVRLSLPLTEVIITVKLTSPLPDVLRLSLPRPRLRHGRRLALLSRQI